MRTMVALLLLIGVIGSIYAQEVNGDQLREAARLPTIQLMFGLIYNSDQGFLLPGEEMEKKSEAIALRKATKGDDTDPARYYHLWELTDDKAESEQFLERAIELARKQWKAQPKNPKAMALLGKALAEYPGGLVEAEKILRQAVELHPDSADCWSALGRYFQSKVVATLGGWKMISRINHDHLMELARKQSFTPEQAVKVEKLLGESLRCHDKAVALAPKESQLYRERVLLRGMEYEVRPTMRFVQGDPPKKPIISAEFVKDWHDIARLSPRDPRAIGVSILTEAVQYMMEKEIPLGTQPFTVLPAKMKQSMKTEMDQLEGLALAPGEQSAARAAEVHGMLSLMVLGDPSAAEKSLRRALALDPSREHAWEGLLIAAIGAGQMGKAISISQDRVKSSDTPRNRFLLAKTYEKAGRLPEAEEQLRLALEKAPDAYVISMGLASIKMKRSREEAALKEVNQLLDKSAKAMDKATTQEIRDQLMVRRGIYLGLKGDVSGAKKLLNDVLSRNGDNEEARTALSALGK